MSLSALVALAEGPWESSMHTSHVFRPFSTGYMLCIYAAWCAEEHPCRPRYVKAPFSDLYFYSQASSQPSSVCPVLQLIVVPATEKLLSEGITLAKYIPLVIAFPGHICTQASDPECDGPCLLVFLSAPI